MKSVRIQNEFPKIIPRLAISYPKELLYFYIGLRSPFFQLQEPFQQKPRSPKFQ